MSGVGRDHGQRVVLIAGPTASGKSALALALAARTDALIINADSMQVYRDLRVITARPTAEEEARVPHRLYGHVDAGENFSTGRWLTDVQSVLSEAAATGRLPIIVGGTGLYFKLLTEGIAAMPAIPAEVRTDLRARFAAEGAAALHAELARADPIAAARVSPNDGTRILRALEVIVATGRSIKEWQQGNLPPIVSPDDAVKVFLTPERDALHDRIDRRFDMMLEHGAIAEVAALAARRLDPLLPVMKAHGVPWLIRHLHGEMTLAEAAAQAKADTRRYTKRQFTWFRNQVADWPWLAPHEAERHLADVIARWPAQA